VSHYYGIVIQQSLRTPDVPPPVRVAATKRVRSWEFLLVEVPEADLDRHVRALQRAMVTDESWYAHYFLGETLIVVFRDASFRVGIEPGTWGPAIEHGLRSGIPLEQLDFTPRTVRDAATFFDLPAPWNRGVSAVREKRPLGELDEA